MKKYKLTKQDKELIKVGKETAIKGFRDDNLSCDLGGALITGSSRIYSGINMDVKNSAGVSICGERSAISQMVSNGERKINTIVAVWISRKYKKNKKWGILPPCGICRHVISQFGNPYVIINKTQKVKLNDLYPLPFK
ncbi:Blasticidin-S deaminase [subsurface metagenome]